MKVKGIINPFTKLDINTLTSLDYYDRLTLIALTLFEWKGLPSSCDAEFLEKTLFTYGVALFVHDDILGYLNLKCNPSGELNYYDKPISYRAYGVGYSNKEFANDECVVIRNNILERPTENSVLLFAKRLSETERTIDVNINAQKTPVIVSCDDKDRLTMINLYKQYEGNEPFILGSKTLNVEGLRVLKTDAPYVADKLQIYKHELWNEAMTFFGIDNVNTEKRERLITDEANANNEIISINADSMLTTRLEACEKINKMYGLEVSVSMRNGGEEEWQDTQQNLEILQEVD